MKTDKETKPPAGAELWREQLRAAAEGMTDRQIAVLVAAAELFGARGYAATSTKEIAARAGVAEGTLFKHFGSKDKLFAALARLIVDRMLLPIIGYKLDAVAAASYACLEEFFAALLQNRADLLLAYSVPIRVVFQEMPYRPDFRENLLAALQALPLTPVFDGLRERGLIRDLPDDELLDLLMAAMVGFIMTRGLIFPERFAGREERDRANYIMFLAGGFHP
jgi:AcrR family transcriptional regulator